jgi:hypothetical protein
MMPRVAILISGRGSNMVALAQAAQNGVLAGRCEIAAVVSSRPAAPGLDRARELGLATFALDARQRARKPTMPRCWPCWRIAAPTSSSWPATCAPAFARAWWRAIAGAS